MNTKVIWLSLAVVTTLTFTRWPPFNNKGGCVWFLFWPLPITELTLFLHHLCEPCFRQIRCRSVADYLGFREISEAASTDVGGFRPFDTTITNFFSRITTSHLEAMLKRYMSPPSSSLQFWWLNISIAGTKLYFLRLSKLEAFVEFPLVVLRSKGVHSF